MPPLLGLLAKLRPNRCLTGSECFRQGLHTRASGLPQACIELAAFLIMALANLRRVRIPSLHPRKTISLIGSGAGDFAPGNVD
jgi:hypothetical protein